MTDREQIKYVDVEGVRTRYYENGAGEPLVLVHGGAIGTAAIYTESVAATHIIRKVMVRMETWMNNLKP